MKNTFSFGQKIGLGFVSVALIAILIGATSLYALRTTVAEKDQVLSVYAQNLINAGRLQVEAVRRVANNRGYLLTQDRQFLDDLRTSREAFDKVLAELRRQGATRAEEQSLGEIDRLSKAQTEAADVVMKLRAAEPNLEAVVAKFQDEVVPRNRDVNAAISAFVAIEEQEMDKARIKSTDSAAMWGNAMIGIGAAGIVLAIGLAVTLSRLLSRQIGSAVQHIQSSSNELQAAANQQTTGSKEQAAAMNEIATTIKELVATARQIAESAQRVANMAEETTRGARAGDRTVQSAQGVVANIKRQVDLIVTHMLDLGGKSQQIGGILEIINEMAEQTNILSINASIEAAGAGESGRRFAVVADEIRKLADRVGGSTKEIKLLIEEVRSAVHTTVMATESGSKAAEAGAREIGEVSAAFEKIVGLVETATEASREIELSTKQQTTAVEQVNVAIANVAQAAKESEVSSSQTLQTVSELTSLSKDLSRLIQPQLSA